MDRPRLSSKTVWNILKIVLAILLIWFVFSKTNFPEVAGLVRQLSLPWLVLGLVLFCSLTLLKTFQYYLLTGRQAPYARVLYVVITQNAVSNFIAGGAGIASYLTMLSVDEGVRFRKALSSFIIVKMGDLLAVWAVLFVTALALWPRIEGIRSAVIVLLAAIMAVVIAFLAAVIGRQKFVQFVSALTRALKLDHFSLIGRGVEMLTAIAEQESRLMVRALLTGLVFSLIYMTVTLFWYYSNIRAYSLVFPFVTVSFVNAFLQLISWVPIQVFGGLGVSETSSVFLFGLFGMPAAEIAAMAIGLRAILYGSTLVVLSYLPLSGLLSAKRKSADPGVGKYN